MEKMFTNSKDQIWKQIWSPGQLGMGPSGSISTLEDDIAIVRHVFNDYLLKNEMVNNFFEESDISWEENKKVIKNLVNRSLKSLSDHPDEGIEIATLTPNWEDDKAFFKELYSITLHNDEEYEQINPQQCAQQ